MRIAVGPRMLAAAGRHPPAGPEHADSPCCGPHRPRATRSRGAGGYRDHRGRARLPRPSPAKPRLRLPERHTLSCLSAGSLGGRSLCTAHDRTWDEHVVTAWAPAAPGTPGPARTGRLSAGDTRVPGCRAGSTGCPRPVAPSPQPLPRGARLPLRPYTLPPPGPGPGPPQLLDAEPGQSWALRPHSGARAPAPGRAAMLAVSCPTSGCPCPFCFLPLMSPSRGRLGSDCQPCTPSPGPRFLDIRNHPVPTPGGDRALGGLSGESPRPAPAHSGGNAHVDLCGSVHTAEGRGAAPAWTSCTPRCPGPSRTASPRGLQHQGQLRPGARMLLRRLHPTPTAQPHASALAPRSAHALGPRLSPRSPAHRPLSRPRLPHRGAPPLRRG